MLSSLTNPAVAQAALSASRSSQSRALLTSIRYFATRTRPKDGKKERVVILGSGWAGYAFARTLDPAKFERIIISPRSYFVFTPLLASTAVGTLEFRTTLESVRRLGKNVRFYQGWADDVDFARKVVRVEENRPDDVSSQTILAPPSPPAQDQDQDQDQKKKKKKKKNTKGYNNNDDVDVDVQVQSPQPPKGPITDVAYDKLVIAVGAYSQTFGIEGVRQHAHFLRDIGDARKIRLRVLSLFEQCTSTTMSDESRRRLLHFAIVGGGPTGVEFAAELHDLIHEDLSRIYPSLMPHVQITVYDISPKILPMFDQALASYAMGMFQRQNIDVKTGHSIQRIRPDPATGGLRLKIKEHSDDDDNNNNEEVGAGMVVWSTGLMQNPFVEKLMRKQSVASMPPPSSSVEGQEAAAAAAPRREFSLARDAKTGGIIVDDRFRARLIDMTAAATQGGGGGGNDDIAGNTALQTQYLDDVFVIGDCAVIDTLPTLPKTAQVASQEAAHLAKALNRRNLLEKPFRFRNLGTMTYLGNWKAIHQSSADHLTGWAAWVLWRTAYLTRSMSIKNKLLVPVYWFVSWVFGRDISRF